MSIAHVARIALDCGDLLSVSDVVIVGRVSVSDVVADATLMEVVEAVEASRRVRVRLASLRYLFLPP